VFGHFIGDGRLEAITAPLQIRWACDESNSGPKLQVKYQSIRESAWKLKPGWRHCKRRLPFYQRGRKEAKQ